MKAFRPQLLLIAFGVMTLPLSSQADAPTPTPAPTATPTPEPSGAAKLKTLLDQWTQDVLTKKDPKDFDALLPQVAEAVSQARMGAFSDSNADRNAAYMQLEGADRFLKSWQSYLIDKNAGNSQAASNELRSLASNNSAFMPIPRSELLERSMKEAVQTPPALETKIELHTLDDLPGAITELEMLQRNGNYNNTMGQISNALQNLQTAYQAYQDKNYSMALQLLVNNYGMGMVTDGPVSTGGNGTSQEPLHKKIAELKNTLLLDVVQAMLAMPDAPTPQKDEIASDYLLRLAAAKAKAGDWTGLQQVLQVYQPAAAAFNQASWLQEDLAGLHSYFIGQKLEAAGQHLDAIRAYRVALATLGKFFPADPVTTQLNDLQKKYPDLYQQALQRPISGNP
jgi:hypothetical protein